MAGMSFNCQLTRQEHNSVLQTKNVTEKPNFHTNAEKYKGWYSHTLCSPCRKIKRNYGRILQEISYH